MKIQNADLEKIVPYAKNPRHNESAIAKVAASIKEFGWQQPIVVDKEMVVIAGHTRLEAARQLGLKKAPVYIADHLTDTQVKAYRIADNRVGAEAKWDDQLLRLEMIDLRDANFELGVTGFDIGEIDNVLLEKQLGQNDAEAEWVGMPEFNQENKKAFRSFPVHFKDQEAVDQFAALINQKITDKTRYVWFPEIEIDRMADKEYVQDDDA